MYWCLVKEDLGEGSKRNAGIFNIGWDKIHFGIPAGTVNPFFDELYTMPHITPVITKHEGAAAYAKYSGNIGVCIGCSGPESTNMLTGAAHAMREQLPVLFLTGAVPTSTVGLNASQEFDAVSVFRPVTKYSVTVSRAEYFVKEAAQAVEIALAGVPGPVHVAMPINLQHRENIKLGDRVKFLSSFESTK